MLSVMTFKSNLKRQRPELGVEETEPSFGSLWGPLRCNVDDGIKLLDLI
jgi:hypothetical protein